MLGTLRRHALYLVASFVMLFVVFASSGCVTTVSPASSSAPASLSAESPNTSADVRVTTSRITEQVASPAAASDALGFKVKGPADVEGRRLTETRILKPSGASGKKCVYLYYGDPGSEINVFEAPAGTTTSISQIPAEVATKVTVNGQPGVSCAAGQAYKLPGPDGKLSVNATMGPNIVQWTEDGVEFTATSTGVGLPDLTRFCDGLSRRG